MDYTTVISNRHIRHDWQTFVNWDQNSVKTICGQKSQPRLSGIPGITDSPADSWCPNCVHKVIVGTPWKNAPLVNILADLRKASNDPKVQMLYDDFFNVVVKASKINAR